MILLLGYYLWMLFLSASSPCSSQPRLRIGCACRKVLYLYSIVLFVANVCFILLCPNERLLRCWMVGWSVSLYVYLYLLLYGCHSLSGSWKAKLAYLQLQSLQSANCLSTTSKKKCNVMLWMEGSFTSSSSFRIWSSSSHHHGILFEERIGYKSSCAKFAGP